MFRDRSSLPPGESFDARIRAAIEESDLFVFLISPASISPGRYTLTELKLAEQKWGHPAGHVLEQRRTMEKRSFRALAELLFISKWIK